jgi:hypothetical protein
MVFEKAGLSAELKAECTLFQSYAGRCFTVFEEKALADGTDDYPRLCYVEQLLSVWMRASIAGRFGKPGLLPELSLSSIHSYSYWGLCS